jgi:hypothetical protein
VLVVTRHVPAEVGAQALFALQGRKRIVRLAVDATAVPGSRGYLWQGSLPAGDPAADVFEGPFVGTLPDAGKISVPGSDLVRALIRRCGARPATGGARRTPGTGIAFRASRSGLRNRRYRRCSAAWPAPPSCRA